jgi:sugar lactone lactonase YvrE
MKKAATLVMGAFTAAGVGLAAQPPVIVVPGTQLYTESMTSTANGTVIISAMKPGAIFRARPGEATARPWIKPGSDGLVNVLGVLADDKSNTLWACSFTFEPKGTTPPPSALHAFNLRTGAPKGRWPLPTTGGLCNDIAIGPDGTAYATDTNNMEVVVLKPGAQSLQVWAGGEAFGPKGGVLDGIAIVRDRVIVNAYQTGRLFSVPIHPDGTAGKVSEVMLDRALEHPDGQRPVGKDALLIVDTGEGGRLVRVNFSGTEFDKGSVTTLKTGFADGPTAVTLVGRTAYVIEGQFATADKLPARPYRAIAAATIQ